MPTDIQVAELWKDGRDVRVQDQLRDWVAGTAAAKDATARAAMVSVLTKALRDGVASQPDLFIGVAVDYEAGARAVVAAWTGRS